MLETLNIQGVVLIDRLDLHFNSGFTVLTGETGAGKSILLDALGLVLGDRANAQLVNPRHTTAIVSASFRLASNHPVRLKLAEQSLDDDETVLLRRVMNKDGKSKAFINDQPVTLNLLKDIGNQLVEIHGQFDHLLDAASHLMALDRYGHCEPLKQTVTAAFETFQEAQRHYDDIQRTRQQAADNHEFLTYAVKELKDLAVKESEEETLRLERDYLVNHTKIVEHLQNIFAKLYGDRGAESFLNDAARSSAKIIDLVPDRFEAIATAIGQALTEIDELRTTVERALELDDEPEKRLSVVEERLFSLRTAARKHAVTINALPALLQKLEHDLNAVSTTDDRIKTLQNNVVIAREHFLKAAQELHQQRMQASQRLEKAIKQELAPLKLDKAEVKISIEPLTQNQWGRNGIDRVEFMIQPNPGMPFGPLIKVASGGERSRFMLALKVLLADRPDMSLLMFDEIDAGVGGAVAAAIGERIARLGTDRQVLAITHAPQVAACARNHMVVAKTTKNEITTTEVVVLNNTDDRREEIARMLAGEHITTQARAAAAQLLGQPEESIRDPSF